MSLPRRKILVLMVLAVVAISICSAVRQTDETSRLEPATGNENAWLESLNSAQTSLKEKTSETLETLPCACNKDQNKKTKPDTGKAEENVFVVDKKSGKKFKVITITIPVDAENDGDIEQASGMDLASKSKQATTNSVTEVKLDNQDAEEISALPAEVKVDEVKEVEEEAEAAKPKESKNGKDKKVKSEKKRSKRDVKGKTSQTKGSRKSSAERKKNGSKSKK